MIPADMATVKAQKTKNIICLALYSTFSIDASSANVNIISRIHALTIMLNTPFYYLFS